MPQPKPSDRIPGAPNFTWGELTKNGSRPIQPVLWRGQTIPPQQVEKNLINVATWLQRLRNKIQKPIQITSGFRPPKINRAVGGAANSYHIPGLAVDFRVEGLSIQDTIEELIKLGFPGGIGVNTRSNFIHLDLGPKRTFTYGNAADQKIVDKISGLRT